MQFGGLTKPGRHKQLPSLQMPFAEHSCSQRKFTVETARGEEHKHTKVYVAIELRTYHKSYYLGL